ncbi:hypothetical protein SPF06_19825 [Sinomonas sp. JGH33]|uniref:Uncharacterized protein n=1 Tax=Sinomonas terricola TaxID=3110330 RepID=A0ABU5TBA7_9MICC|nr:hypothetical protein [Sinomonas sp. JGH33]MEA5456978.1 hypothetical protein [Sinomonas sp. JGH33]
MAFRLPVERFTWGYGQWLRKPTARSHEATPPQRSGREALRSDTPFERGLRAAGDAYVGFSVAHPQILAVMFAARHDVEASKRCER